MDQFISEQTRRSALTTVLRNLVDVDPTLAFQTALKQPLTKHGRGLEAAVIEQLARTDLERAISMLSQVRDGRTKLHAYNSAGRALVQNGNNDRALQLGQQLPDEYRSAYLQSVMWQWAEADPETLLASLDELPSQEAKTQAAFGLVTGNVRTKALSDDQMKHVAGVLREGMLRGGVVGSDTFTFSTMNSSEVRAELPDRVKARVFEVIEQAAAAADVAVGSAAEENAVIFIQNVKVSDSEED